MNERLLLVNNYLSYYEDFFHTSYEDVEDPGNVVFGGLFVMLSKMLAHFFYDCEIDVASYDDLYSLRSSLGWIDVFSDCDQSVTRLISLLGDNSSYFSSFEELDLPYDCLGDLELIVPDYENLAVDEISSLLSAELANIMGEHFSQNLFDSIVGYLTFDIHKCNVFYNPELSRIFKKEPERFDELQYILGLISNEYAGFQVFNFYEWIGDELMFFSFVSSVYDGFSSIEPEDDCIFPYLMVIYSFLDSYIKYYKESA